MDFVFGALAVGVIALARELLVDRTRWKREQRAYDRVTRAARRLIADELDTNQHHLALMLAKGVWPVSEFVERATLLPATEWDLHKSRLAEAVDDEHTWIVLAAFYYSLRQLRARALSAEAGLALTAREREQLESMRNQAIVLEAILSEGATLPANWREQLAAIREAGAVPAVEKPQPRTP